jgi:hypothetical protein
MLPFLLASTLPYWVEYHRALRPCSPNTLPLRAPYASLFFIISSLMVVAGVGGPAVTFCLCIGMTLVRGGGP